MDTFSLFLLALFACGGSMPTPEPSEELQADSGNQKQPPFVITTYNNPNNVSVTYIRMMRERDAQLHDNRMKQLRLELIKQNILNYTGHVVQPMQKINDTLNLSQLYQNAIKNIQSEDNTNINQQVIEKIRSYYPSCEYPRNTDEDLWNNKSLLNLYFNISTEDTIKSSASFLRLYRIQSENVTTTRDLNNDYTDEKLLRVSVYYYVKPLRKNTRPKKRLSDSKVINENAQWVELSIRQALNAWTKGRNKNLGLNIVVDDQDEIILKPTEYFKGPSCMLHQNPSHQFSSTLSEDRRNGIDTLTLRTEPLLVSYHFCPQ